MFGIPVKVHVSLWILLPLIALRVSPLGGHWVLFWGLLTAVGLFASVALHELGHSLVAITKGCRVREIMLLPIGGVAKLEGMPQRPRDEILVALAGPFVSIVLGVLLLGSGFLIQRLGLSGLGWVLTFLGSINLGLAVFNLLPSFPMDGGRVFRAWLTPRYGRLEATRRAAKVGRIMAVIFGVIALLSYPTQWVLLGVAIFVYIAAGAEYRMVQIQERLRGGGLFETAFWQRPVQPPPPPGPDDFIVGPPPYAREKGLVEKLRDALHTIRNHMRL